MDDAIKEHVEKFGVEPVVIGLFWDNPEKVLDGIYDAIDEGTPYDEHNLLTEEEREAYDAGELLF